MARPPAFSIAIFPAASFRPTRATYHAAARRAGPCGLAIKAGRVRLRHVKPHFPARSSHDARFDFLHHAYAAAAIAFAGTLALTPAVRALCIRLQILDVPGPLKIHTRAVPRLGGAAIFIAIFAATICSSPANGRSIAAFLAALAVVWLAGFIDDLRNLSPAICVAAPTRRRSTDLDRWLADHF